MPNWIKSDTALLLVASGLLLVFGVLIALPSLPEQTSSLFIAFVAGSCLVLLVLEAFATRGRSRA